MQLAKMPTSSDAKKLTVGPALWGEARMAAWPGGRRRRRSSASPYRPSKIRFLVGEGGDQLNVHLLSDIELEEARLRSEERF